MELNPAALEVLSRPGGGESRPALGRSEAASTEHPVGAILFPLM